LELASLDLADDEIADYGETELRPAA